MNTLKKTTSPVNESSKIFQKAQFFKIVRTFLKFLFFRFEFDQNFEIFIWSAGVNQGVERQKSSCMRIQKMRKCATDPKFWHTRKFSYKIIIFIDGIKKKGFTIFILIRQYYLLLAFVQAKFRVEITSLFNLIWDKTLIAAQTNDYGRYLRNTPHFRRLYYTLYLEDLWRDNQVYKWITNYRGYFLT